VAKGKTYWYEKADGLRQKVKDFVRQDSTSALTDLPPDSKKPDLVSNYINLLFEDSAKWKDGSLYDRATYATTPNELWRMNRLLEQGRHFDVHGTRKTPQDPDKHELVDPETGKQCRAKKAYLTGNWHEVTVTPNIKHIDSILKQELENTEWGAKIRNVVHQANTEGTAVAYSFLDKSKHPEGMANEILLDNESLFPTPYIGETYSRTDGCWYVIVATLQDSREMLRQYPDLDKTKLVAYNSKGGKKVTKDESSLTGYDQTKLVLKLDCWMDDDTLVEADFSAEDFDVKKFALDEAARAYLQEPELDDGDLIVEVLDTEHHEKHIEAYASWLEEIVGAAPEEMTEEDEDYIAVISTLIERQIGAHDEMEKNSDLPSGKKLKYPTGRHIVLVSDEVAVDEGSEWSFDWRALFHKMDHENVAGQHWGRGMPEVLYPDQYVLDTMLSRIADIGLFVGMPTPWLNEMDKEMIEDRGISNHPKRPNYYRGAPPVFPKGTAPQEFYNLYSGTKENIKESLGVSDTAMGKSPHSRASAALADLLLQQASVMIAGETANNLLEFVKSILETRIMMMREAYISPRLYRIEGHYRPVSVAQSLQYETIVDEKTGETRETPIPKIEVSVEPESNYPGRWLKDVTLLARMTELLGPENIPPEAVLDLLGERFPEFKQGGKHRHTRQIIQLGLQKMAEMEEQQKRENEASKQVEQRVSQVGLDSLLSPDTRQL
jgi:hypothetical protein